ncbi:MAG TPA: DNA-3-methyladenine glycosylase 2 family protein [Actinomycetes bacterium]|jgi:3-methyladenine DNA glycosylase/8-oxoguanine DNA glycosylase|nr:DNA-3-methyladenine glycosylase 2 family protein [Actinomycetes bacterium]
MSAAQLPLETVVRPRLPVDLRLTLGPLRRGPGDPTTLVDRSGAWWRATRTPQGPATARYTAAGGAIRVDAWGPGAEWCLAAAPELLGARDTLDGFSPTGLVAELHHRFPGLRISRSLAVFEALLPSILEQKVAGLEARNSFRAIVRAWGEPAPGPRPLLLQPTPAAIAVTPYWSFHPFGVERKRTTAILMAASRARRVEETVALPAAEAHRRLQALPGVGPWTSAEVAIVALGDADAVSVGDFHLPHLVSYVLAGEPRGTDERMLELLSPWPGHRGRVARLLTQSGRYPPRRGPRMPLRSYTRI